MFELEKLKVWVEPLGIVLIALLAGLVIERLLLPRLKRLFARWGADEILISPLRGVATLLFLTAGFRLALEVVPVPIKDSVSKIIHELLLVLTILLVTIFVARVFVGFVNAYAQRVEGVIPSTILTNLTRFMVFLIGFLMVLQTLGVSITPVLTALGVGGLAVALALQDTLANFFSGIYIIMSKQVRVGDYVKTESGEEGYVTDIQWRHTTIRAIQNNLIMVPNSKLASSIIVNYHRPEPELSVLVQVGVSYASDLENVQRVTLDVAGGVMREIEGGVPEFEPLIRYHTFDDFSINFTVVLRAQEYGNQFMIKHEFVKRLHRRYKEEGIEIPFPIRTVVMQGKPLLDARVGQMGEAVKQPTREPSDSGAGPG